MDLQWGYPTMEALRLCREALDLNREGHFDESIARFLEAWKVDTLWVLPLWHASGPLHNKGDYAMSDSLTRIAFRLRDQVTEPSRFAILSSLAYYDGDFYLAQRYRCQALEAESGRTAAHAANCAYFSVRANRPQRALEAYEEAARVAGVPLLDLPPGPIAAWAADAYHMMGDYTNELSTAGAILAEVPEIAPLIFHYASLRALIGSGRLHEVERGIEELATIAVSDIDAVERLLGLGLELRYHGHHEASTRALRRVERILTENVIDNSAGRRARLTHASVLYHLEDWDAAWRELQELHSLDSTSEVDENLEIALQGYSGLTAARIGDAESAATHEAWLRRRDDGARYLFGVPKGYIARIAAVQGRRDEAVGMLRQAHAEGLSYWPRWGLQHQSRFDFESLADYEPYQDLMRPKG